MPISAPPVGAGGVAVAVEAARTPVRAAMESRRVAVGVTRPTVAANPTAGKMTRSTIVGAAGEVAARRSVRGTARVSATPNVRSTAGVSAATARGMTPAVRLRQRGRRARQNGR